MARQQEEDHVDRLISDTDLTVQELSPSRWTGRCGVSSLPENNRRHKETAKKKITYSKSGDNKFSTGWFYKVIISG